MSTPPSLNTFSQFAPLLIQQYESYLPNAFDDSLTLLQKVNKIIQSITTSNTTLNDLINQWNTEIVPYVNSDGFQTDVNNKLDAMANDGTLTSLINNDVFNGMNTYTTDSTVDVSSIASGTIYSLDQLRKSQNILLSNFYKKLRLNNAVLINCLGDSTTYGRDTVSADKVASDTTPLPDGTIRDSSDTRASTTYPQALQSRLTEIGYSNATVTTSAYTGDTTLLAYNRWTKNVNSQLTLISFGLNDLSEDIQTFRDNYIKLISREILRGSGVVILTPFTTNQPKDSEVYIKACIYDLAQMFGCPLIEMDKIIDNYSTDIHSDDFHLNGSGYGMVGARLTAIFIGDIPSNPNFVMGGSKVLTRLQTDRVIMVGATYDSNGALDTPDEIYSGIGFGAKMVNSGDRVYFSFYTNEDDLIILPDLFRSGTTSVEITLDFNVEKQKISLNEAIHGINGTSVTDIVTDLTLSNPVYRYNLTGISDKRYIYVARRGWHTLCIKKLDSTGTWWANGLDILSYNDYKSLFLKGFYKFTVTPSVATVTINIDDLASALGVTLIDTTDTHAYWNALPVGISIHNYDDSIYRYVMILGNCQDSTTWKLATNSTTYTLPSATGVHRLLQSISYDNSSRTLTLTFDTGTKTAEGVLTVG